MSKMINALKMLQLLKNNGCMKIQDIATTLEVKERMVRNYKKELIEAGYCIKSIKGPNGGYYLEKNIDEEFKLNTHDKNILCKVLQRIIDVDKQLAIEYKSILNNLFREELIIKKEGLI